MKKYLFALLLSGLALSINAQQSSDEPFLTKSLSADNIQSVDVETTGGNIYVEGVDAQARIDVYVWPGNGRNKNLSKAEIQKRLDEDYTLTISVSNNKLTAIAKPKTNFRNWNNSLEISFKVYVPHKVSTELATSGGNISLAGLSGKQDFSTSGGNLAIDHVSGDINGRTSGGNISLSNASDNIDLRTSGGNIKASNSHGDLKLITSGGSLTLNDLQGKIDGTTSGGNVNGENIEGELLAKTSGGNVRMTDLSCSLETSTSGGNISVSIKTLGKYVKITNSSGNIDLQIPQDKGVTLKLYADKIKLNTFSNFKGDIEENRVEGTLAGGGVPVTVHGNSGRVNVTLK